METEFKPYEIEEPVIMLADFDRLENYFFNECRDEYFNKDDFIEKFDTWLEKLSNEEIKKIINR